MKVYPDWQGSYDTVGLNGTPLTENMLFHVVIVADQLDANGQLTNWVLVVPEHWVDCTSKFVLYPAPDITIHGILSKDWNEMAFNRRRFPTTLFVEYCVEDFVTDNLGMNNFSYLLDMLHY